MYKCLFGLSVCLILAMICQGIGLGGYARYKRDYRDDKPQRRRKLYGNDPDLGLNDDADLVAGDVVEHDFIHQNHDCPELVAAGNRRRTDSQ